MAAVVVAVWKKKIDKMEFIFKSWILLVAAVVVVEWKKT